MEMYIRSIILAVMMGIGGKSFFETIMPRRKWKCQWLEYTLVPAFAAGFLFIAFTPIPPYIIQPLRAVIIVAVVVQIYFEIKLIQNLVLSVLFWGVYWLVSMLVISVYYIIPSVYMNASASMPEILASCIHLCLMLVFHYRYKNRIQGLTKNTRWVKFGYLPVFSMIVLVAVSMTSWDETVPGGNARLAAVAGFGVINLCMFYIIGNMLEKENELQKLRLIHEQTQNHMQIYHNVQKNYERQRKFLHDYKNQLNCMQGMLMEGNVEETLRYMSQLTGNLKKNADYVNTNHMVVNVVLNQKYQEAMEKGITMTMAVNDLSKLAMKEEELVTLLVNLIDNAIEACEKLDSNRVIQIKIISDEGQFIFSIRNPVKEPVQIKGKTVVTSKRDISSHGIGLSNVDSVIRKNGGTSVLTCENGWFYFSLMIPLSQI